MWVLINNNKTYSNEGCVISIKDYINPCKTQSSNHFLSLTSNAYNLLDKCLLWAVVTQSTKQLQCFLL